MGNKQLKEEGTQEHQLLKKLSHSQGHLKDLKDISSKELEKTFPNRPLFS